MRTIKNDRKRALLFNSIIENWINGNSSDAVTQLNALSKIDLIRLTNKLRFYGYRIYIDVTEDKKLRFYESEKL